MKRLTLGGRSRTLLLIVIGVLVVPTVALGAKIASSWQSGSPTVRKLGPLPMVSVTLSPDSWDGYYYSVIVPYPIPTTSVSGGYVTNVVWAATVTIPESVIVGLSEAFEEHPDLDMYCDLFGAWGIWDGPRSDFFGGAAYQSDLFWFTVRSESEVADLMAGTHSFSFDKTHLGPSFPSMLGQGSIAVAARCQLPYTDEQVVVDFGSSPIEVSVTSLRMLAI